ncbi:hypothetical protein Hanom_Chr09g00773811 [Helianthus anomalus]
MVSHPGLEDPPSHILLLRTCSLLAGNFFGSLSEQSLFSVVSFSLYFWLPIFCVLADKITFTLNKKMKQVFLRIQIYAIISVDCGVASFFYRDFCNICPNFKKSTVRSGITI